MYQTIYILGGYFMLADISKIALNFESDSNECKDSKFVKYLIKEKVSNLKKIYLNLLKNSSYREIIKRRSLFETFYYYFTSIHVKRLTF
jgi:hypothetical protein